MLEFKDYIEVIDNLVYRYGVELDSCAWIEIKKQLQNNDADLSLEISDAWENGCAFGRNSSPSRNSYRAMFKYMHKKAYIIPKYLIKSIESPVDDKLDCLTQELT